MSAIVDLIPERRVASIENAWVANAEVHAGDEVPVKVFLRPYRGPRLEREFNLKVPDGLAKGDHRILLSDAETANRMQNMAGTLNHYMDLPETVSLINQERTNNKLRPRCCNRAPRPITTIRRCPACPRPYERDAGRPGIEPSGDDVGRQHGGTNRHPLRIRDQRQLHPEDYREVERRH